MLPSYSVVLLASVFGAVSMANPIANAEVAPAVLDSGLETRQAEVRCLAVAGLGNPRTASRCGSINFRPNASTEFNPVDPAFPDCRITVEIAYPNCNAYRVTSVTGCGGERAIDIREPSRGC